MPCENTAVPQVDALLAGSDFQFKTYRHRSAVGEGTKRTSGPSNIFTACFAPWSTVLSRGEPYSLQISHLTPGATTSCLSHCIIVWRETYASARFMLLMASSISCVDLK